jgi:hypothetical protein
MRATARNNEEEASGVRNAAFTNKLKRADATLIFASD